MGWRTNYAQIAAVGEGVCFSASLPRPARPRDFNRGGAAQVREALEGH
ncbi:MAG: hypothetical protein LBT01_01405 [Spirochaetaceae bacterium]|nr:hypothetical protein [Spirochaetaceae bacterium]